jgi:hypothetical protein
MVGDAKRATTTLEQVKKIELWTTERRTAAELILRANELRERAGGSAKNVLEPAIAAWTERYRRGNVDAKWVQEESSRLTLLEQAFESERKKSAAAVIPQPAPPPAEAIGASDNGAHGGADLAQAATLPFHHIAQSLAECRDLAEAVSPARPGESYGVGIEYPPQIAEFEVRQWQLQNEPRPPAVQALREEVDTFHGSLLKRATEQSKTRLGGLQRRWQRFQEIYQDPRARSDISELVAEAEAAKPDAASGFRKCFQIIENALNRIHTSANIDRPRLATAVRKAVEQCRVELTNVRQQARPIAVDALLVQAEGRIPPDMGSQADVRIYFDQLDQCENVLHELTRIVEQNQRYQQECLTHTLRLRELAASISRIGKPQEAGVAAASIAERLSGALPATVPLDTISDLLKDAEKQLDLLVARVRAKCAADLADLRKENVAWMRLLTEFSQSEVLPATYEPPPQDLDALHAVLEAEERQKQRLATLAAEAAQDLESRKSQVCTHLREHLDNPAFETHPERDSAANFLTEVEEVAVPVDQSKRDLFSHAYNTIAEAEAFIDRLEAAQRELPGRVKILEDRFTQLRELNAIDYRQELSRRANALLLGMQQAIAQQQWDPLPYQLVETDALISALEADARTRITSETEVLLERLRKAMKNSNDNNFIRQADAVVLQLEDAGHLTSPSYQIRQRLNRLLSRTAVAPEVRRGGK